MESAQVIHLALSPQASAEVSSAHQESWLLQRSAPVGPRASTKECMCGCDKAMNHATNTILT